jgi:flagellar basal-body rod protein FlgB
MGALVDGLFDKSIPALKKTLDLNQKRLQALTSNIANAETPQYRAMDVTFAGELQKAFGGDYSPLQKTDPHHMDLSDSDASHYVPDYTGATRADGNNVDLDVQMGKMSKVSGDYSIAANLVRQKLRTMRTAVTQQ